MARKSGRRAKRVKSGKNWTDYRQYLQSKTWRGLRRKTLKRDNYCCRVCQSTENLNVHHCKYPSEWGTEPLEWLFTVCQSHHEEIHKIAARGDVSLERATKRKCGKNISPELRVEVVKSGKIAKIKNPKVQRPVHKVGRHSKGHKETVVVDGIKIKRWYL